jgi:hypothetical protein
LFLANELGPIVRGAPGVAIAITLVILLASLTIVVEGALQCRAERRRQALALLCVVGVVGLMTLGFGCGRAALVPTTGMPTRHVLLAAPAYCLAYFAWELFGSPVSRALVQWVLAIGVVLLLPLNLQAGFEERDWYRKGMQAVQSDLRSNISSDVLAERYRPFLVHWWRDDQLALSMRMLKDAGIGPFTLMADTGTDADAR